MHFTRIKFHRLRRDQRQIDVAQQAGLHPSTLSLIETGRRQPTAEELERLAEVLDVPVLDLEGEVSAEAQA